MTKDQAQQNLIEVFTKQIHSHFNSSLGTISVGLGTADVIYKAHTTFCICFTMFENAMNVFNIYNDMLIVDAGGFISDIITLLTNKYNEYESNRA